MLVTLVKNNTKLLIRSKVGFIFLCLLPIALILILTSAFSGTLGATIKLERFSVGYSLKEDSPFGKAFEAIKKQFESHDILLEEMDENQGIEALKEGKIVSFLVLNGEHYTLYTREGVDIKAMLFESSFQTALTSYHTAQVLMNYKLENQYEVLNSSNLMDDEKLFGQEGQTFVRRRLLHADPVPKAKDYYGIVQIIFVIWFSVSSAVNLAAIERKNKIIDRIQMTNVKPITFFLGRFIPNILATSLQVGIAVIVSTLFLKVNWGEKALLSFSLLFLQVTAVSAFGTMLTVIIKNSTLITLFMYIGAFVFGFIGGSFQTYMYNFVDKQITHLSPLYYLNRTLVELSTKGQSSYLQTTWAMLTTIITVSFAIGLTAMYLRREG